MKQISTNLLAVLCVMLLLFTACKKNSDFTVEGVVSGADGQMMYLENVGVSTVELMDSVKLTAAGKFSFTKPRPAFPDFYRLRQLLGRFYGDDLVRGRCRDFRYFL